MTRPNAGEDATGITRYYSHLPSSAALDPPDSVICGPLRPRGRTRTKAWRESKGRMKRSAALKHRNHPAQHHQKKNCISV
ncbi:hypothetical protein NDU88_004673 [Pleurodeles waltl]|uniref:Uncharacterized protein n=1 Tax=Pleurodeles waltl TaxID=8319 RepID=A0AAV7V1T8_PLEWA|nr:hypothetical protein NDU88_004673 [Pleurodeles waltl]